MVSIAWLDKIEELTKANEGLKQTLLKQREDIARLTEALVTRERLDERFYVLKTEVRIAKILFLDTRTNTDDLLDYLFKKQEELILRLVQQRYQEACDKLRTEEW